MIWRQPYDHGTCYRSEFRDRQISNIRGTSKVQLILETWRWALHEMPQCACAKNLSNVSWKGDFQFHSNESWLKRVCFQSHRLAKKPIVHISILKTSDSSFHHSYNYDKHFDDSKFKYDLIQVCFHAAEIFDNIYVSILPNECSLM